MRTPKVLTAIGLVLAASVASANMVQTFTADGVTDSTAQQGTATFDFNGSMLTLTLTDDVTPTSKIASLLDGIVFTLSETPLTSNLVSVSPDSVINCSGIASSSCPPGDGSSPYGYGSTQTGATIELGAGINPDGTFSYKPYGIVNTSYVSPGGSGGLSNSQHNPLLVGPVKFIFDLTGLSGSQEVTSVTFKFGTVPDSQPGACTSGACTPSADTPVPEPQTLALLSIGLLGIGWSMRRAARQR